jgi:hypothetical protein
MSTRTHFIVAKSRNGWGVNVESDLLSEHPHAKEARDAAVKLTDGAKREGEPARFVDLSSPEDD